MYIKCIYIDTFIQYIHTTYIYVCMYVCMYVLFWVVWSPELNPRAKIKISFSTMSQLFIKFGLEFFTAESSTTRIKVKSSLEIHR